VIAEAERRVHQAIATEVPVLEDVREDAKGLFRRLVGDLVVPTEGVADEPALVCQTPHEGGADVDLGTAEVHRNPRMQSQEPEALAERRDGRVGIEHEHVEARVHVVLLEERERTLVHLHRDAATERTKSLRRARLDPDVDAQKTDLLEHGKHVLVEVVGASLDDDRHVVDLAPTKLVPQPRDAREIASVVAREKIVVVKDEHSGAACRSELADFVCDVASLRAL